MTEALRFERDTTALLLMDFQPGILANYGGDASPALHNAIRLRDAARNAGMLVVFVTVGFRDGYPEVSPRNRAFAELRESGRLLASSGAADVHPKLAPQAGEPQVMKRRVGAFSGTDLDLILRAHNIDTLVLSGIATSGVVLSTLRVAADLDYRCTVVADACADGDAEVHACLTQKVFLRQALVADTDALLKIFASVQ
jgi:nicotinamidase-related amidase